MPDETPEMLARRHALEAHCNQLACLVDARLAARWKKKIGFTLLLFDFDGSDHSDLAYVSNAKREDMVRGLVEHLCRLGHHQALLEALAEHAPSARFGPS